MAIAAVRGAAAAALGCDPPDRPDRGSRCGSRIFWHRVARREPSRRRSCRDQCGERHRQKRASWPGDAQAFRSPAPAPIARGEDHRRRTLGRHGLGDRKGERPAAGCDDSTTHRGAGRRARHALLEHEGDPADENARPHRIRDRPSLHRVPRVRAPFRQQRRRRNPNRNMGRRTRDRLQKRVPSRAQDRRKRARDFRARLLGSGKEKGRRVQRRRRPARGMDVHRHVRGRKGLAAAQQGTRPDADALSHSGVGRPAAREVRCRQAARRSGGWPRHRGRRRRSFRGCFENAGGFRRRGVESPADRCRGNRFFHRRPGDGIRRADAHFRGRHALPRAHRFDRRGTRHAGDDFRFRPAFRFHGRPAPDAAGKDRTRRARGADGRNPVRFHQAPGDAHIRRRCAHPLAPRRRRELRGAETCDQPQDHARSPARCRRRDRPRAFLHDLWRHPPGYVPRHRGHCGGNRIRRGRDENLAGHFSRCRAIRRRHPSQREGLRCPRLAHRERRRTIRESFQRPPGDQAGRRIRTPARAAKRRVPICPRLRRVLGPPPAALLRRRRFGAHDRRHHRAEWRKHLRRRGGK